MEIKPYPENLLEWKPVAIWVDLCHHQGQAHGVRLLDLILQEEPKIPAHEMACDILDFLEKRGDITPGKYSPTVEHHFFGVGGRPPGKTPRVKGAYPHGHTRPVEFIWTWA
jgi:hypothetical protein